MNENRLELDQVDVSTVSEIAVEDTVKANGGNSIWMLDKNNSMKGMV